MERNIRFNVHMNGGVVKMTLKPGESLTHHSYEPNDEGYNAASETWSFKDGYLCLDVFTHGRDCDGRVSSTTELRCPADRVNAGRNGYGDPTPEWDRTSSRHRDYSAEAAGY